MDNMYRPLASITLTLRDLYGEDNEHMRRLSFHIETGDYFAMLATIIGFVEETLKGAKSPNQPLQERELLLMQELKKDLVHLQEHYEIRSKDASDTRQEKSGVIQ